MDMAIGVIIGGAFSGIVTSLTDNFINPILNVLTGGATYTLKDVSGFEFSGAAFSQLKERWRCVSMGQIRVVPKRP